MRLRVLFRRPASVLRGAAFAVLGLACTPLAFADPLPQPVAEMTAPAVAAPTGEAPSAPPAHTPLTADMVETKLLFGLSAADGNGVSKQEWADFLAKEITPRFPDGLTIIAAYGQVKGEAHNVHEVVREEMRLALIVHHDTPEAAARLAEIRALYAQRFRQWGVLQISQGVRVTL